MRPRAVLVVALGALACGDNLLSHDPLALPVLVDTNPDPDIVEVELVAAVATTTYVDGVRTELWGYRDGSVAGSKVSVPGPTLEVPLGSRVIVHFTQTGNKKFSCITLKLRNPGASGIIGERCFQAIIVKITI